MGRESEAVAVRIAAAAAITLSGVVVLAPHIPVEAATAPSEGLIAFASNRDGDDEIWVMSPDGSGQVQVTANSFGDAEPAWSPDGTKLAFSSDRDGNHELYVVAVDEAGVPTGEAVNISNTPGGDFSPAWSPDGTQIAFSSDRGVATNLRSIYVMNADGSNPVELSDNNNQGSDFAPAWSPDGSTIAYGINHQIVGTTFTSALYLIDADGSDQRFLAASSGTTDPTWSPDGFEIAFSSVRNGEQAIVATAPDGSVLVDLTRDLATTSDTLPAWSPDGTQVAFTGSVSGGPRDIFVAGIAPGSVLANLSNHPSDDREPAWRPIVAGGLVADDLQLAEANEGLVRFTRADATTSLDVDITMVDGTAVADADYDAVATGRYNLVPGQTELLISVFALSDQLDEPNETFTVTATPTSGQGGPAGQAATATVTIVDNRTNSLFTVVAPSLLNEDAGEFSVSILADELSPVDRTFDISVESFEATAGEDFVAASGTVTVPAGSSFSTSVLTRIIDDDLDEFERERLIITATEVGSGTLGGTFVTIVDNERSRARFDGRPVPPPSEPDRPLERSFSESANRVQLQVSLLDQITLAGVAYEVTPTLTGKNDEATARIAAGSVTVEPATLTFSSTRSTAVVTLTIAPNDVLQPDLSFLLTLDNAERQGQLGLPDDVMQIVVLDDDAVTPRLTVADSSVAEAAGEVAIELTSTPVLPDDRRFSVTVEPSGASQPDDFGPVPSIVTIPAGRPSGTLRIPIVNDQLDEDDEAFTVRFDEIPPDVDGTPPPALVGAATVTIIDDDQPPPNTLSSPDVRLLEASGRNSIVLTRSDGAGALSIPVRSESGSAVAGLDYLAVSETVEFADGDTSLILPVTTIADLVDEGTESFTLIFAEDTALELTTTISIDNFDASGFAVTTGPAQLFEGGAGSVSVQIPNELGARLRLVADIVPGTATTADFASTAPQTFEVPSESIFGSVNIVLVDDSLFEGNETFTVNIRDEVGGRVLATSVVTIVDNERTVTIGDATVAESVGDAIVAVTLDTPATSTFSLAVDVRPGSATNADFDASSFPTTLVVPAGSQTVDVRIPIVPDDLFDATESFSVRVLDAVGGTPLATSTVTIIDDDALPAVTLTSNSPYDESAGVVSAILLLSRPAGSPLTFDVAAQDLEAVTDEDYRLISTTATIPTGTTSAFVRLEIIDNVSNDHDRERFVINAFIDDAQLAAETVTIIDLDADPDARFVRQASDPDSAFVRRLVEGTLSNATLPLVVRLDPATFEGAHDVEITINSLDDLNAGEPDDFSLTPSTVRFEPGDSSQTFTFTANADDIEEPNGVFVIGLMIDGRLTDEAIVTIVDDDAPPTPTVGDDLRDGIGGWFDDWFGGAGDPGSPNDGFDDGFDLPDIDWPGLRLPEFTPPVLPDVDLRDLFDLDDLFDGVSSPTFDVNADTLEEIVADFDSVGCPADFVAGGIAGKPNAAPGDVIQVRCTRTLAQILERSGYTGPDLNGATPDVLAGLAAQMGLVADIEWSLDATVVLVAGIDVDGFYVLGESGMRVVVSGNGSAFGSGTVLGVQNTTVDGVASGATTVGMRLAIDRSARMRVADLAAITPATLVPTFDGDASIDLTARVDDSTLVWSGDWTTGSNERAESGATTRQTLQFIQDLPGFAIGDVSAPTTIDVVGTLTTRGGVAGWDLTGTATPAAGLHLGGFTVTRLELNGFVSAAVADITVEVGLLIGNGPSAVEVTASLTIDGSEWHVDTIVDAAVVRIGAFEFDDVELTIEADHTLNPNDEIARVISGGGETTSVAIGLSASAGRMIGPDGIAVVARMTGIAGSMTSSSDVRFSATTFDAAIGDALDLSLTDVTLSTPGPDGVVLSVGDATATSAALGGLVVTVTGLVVHVDGRFSAQSAEVAQPAGFAEAVGLGGIVPVDLTRLRLAFTNVDANGAVVDLSQFVVTVDGTVDLSGFAALPFDPVVGLGGAVITPASPPEAREISFSAFVESVDPLVVTPLDLGPITLGMRNLTVGSTVIDAEIRAEGFVDGVLQPSVGGAASIVGGFGAMSGSVEATLDGRFVDGASGLEVAATGRVRVDAAERNGASITDLAATLDLRFGVDTTGGSATPFLVADLIDVTVGNVTVPFGEFATIQLGAATLDLTPGADDLVFSVGGSLDNELTGAGITFDSGIDLLDGWGGRIGGFGIGVDFDPVFLDGFFVDITVPDDERFGLPDFVPLRIDSIGLGLPPGMGPGDSLVDLLASLQFSVSGGLQGTPQFPVTATVDQLTVDIAKLIAFDPLAPLDFATFPITNLSGLSFAIDPELDLGGARVSGALTFGVIDVERDNGTTEDVLYGRIAGNLSTPAFDAGADLVISEYGPVLLRVTAPLGVPIGPTGLLLTSVTGAAAFGDVSIPTPRPGHPEDLLTEVLTLPTDASINEATIRAAVTGAVNDGNFTWDQGFAVALEGDLTHVAAAGMMKGKVTFATMISPTSGAQLVGRGEVEVFGIPLAEGIDISGSVAAAGIMIDLSRPLEPQIDIAYTSPTPGSPLAVVFPARAEVSAQLVTTGVIPGVAAGLDAFVEQLSTTTLERVARRLDADRSSPLARLVLDTDRNGAVSDAERAVAITAPRLLAQVHAWLADPVGLGSIIGPLIVAISNEVGSLTSEQAAALIDDFVQIVGDAGAAALRAAGDQFDPSFVFKGALQPLLLGIPVGSPDNSVEVIIDRSSLGFTLTTSMIENLKNQVGLLTGTGALGESLITAVTLGARDDLQFGVQLPMPSLIDVILGNGAFPTLDAGDANQEWSVLVSGQFTQFGLAAQVTGFITSPENKAFLDQRVERRYLADGTIPPQADKVQLTRQIDYDNLLRYGGIVLSGRLEAPRLLTDPVDVLADVPPFPENALDIPVWLEAAGEVVLATETPAQITLIVPGLGEVMAAPAGSARDAAMRDWANAVSVTGAFDGTRQTPTSKPVARLLSLPIGEGRLLATASGVEVTAHVPLIGLDGTFVLRADATLPSGGLEVALTSDELQRALVDLGLPPVFDAAGVNAGASLRAFTPGFDPDSTDALRRTGGIAINAFLDVDGLVDNAEFDLAIDAVGTGFGPDFAAHAAVDKIGPLGGVEIRAAHLDVTKVGKEITVDLGGEATLFGSEWTVKGNLKPDLTGRLVLTGKSGQGQLPNISGFKFVDAGFVLELTRVAGKLTASLGLGGTVALPTWLSGRAGQTTATVIGCIATGGASEFRIGIGSIKLNASGTATITGTGQPLAVDPQAACTLPANVTPIGVTDARFVLRTTAGGVTTVAVDGAIRLTGTDVPLLSVNGALSTDGTGSLTAQFGASGLDRSGFKIRGDATLTLTGGANFTLAVNGRTSIPGIVTNATVTGQITQNGIQTLAIGVTGLTLPNVTVNAASLNLQKVGTGYEVQFGATVTVPGLTSGTTRTPTVRIDGAVLPSGDFSIAMSGSNFTLVGVPVTGTFELAKAGSSLSVKASASSKYSLWSTQLVVSGSLTISISGLSGDVTLSLPGGLKFNGFAVGGTLKISFAIGSVNQASIGLTNGSITIPGIGTLVATASLNTNGTGFIQISTTTNAGTGIRLGGSASPIFAVGTYRLQLVDNVVTFSAAQAGVEYRDGATVVFRAAVPSFAISSNGAFLVPANGFTIGAPTGLRIVVPSASVTAEPAGANLKINLPAAKLFIPGLADDAIGRPALTTTPIFIDTSAFRKVLFDAKQLDLGLIRLNGKLVFERPAGGAFRLAVEATTAGVPHVDLGELGRVEFPNFFVDSNGDFDITATTTRIGTTTPRFEIRDASFRFRRSAGTVSLAINGGELQVPSLSQRIELPDLAITLAAEFSQNIDLPSIDLGPFFHSDAAKFALKITRTNARFELRDIANNDPTVTVFADSTSMTLRSLVIDSDGVFSGEVTGRLALFGHRITQASLDVSLSNGVLQLTLPASDNENLDLGFIEIEVSGFARSDGTFSFTGSATTSGAIPVIGPSWNGAASMTVANTGIIGRFNGNVSFLGLSGQAEAAVSSTGRASGTLGVDLNGNGNTNGFTTCVGIAPLRVCNFTAERASFQFDLGTDPAGPDTTRPTIGSAPNVTVTTSQAAGSIPVYYAQPTATDTRDGQLASRCTPGSGGLFVVGQATTVSCSARDAAGNTATKSFTVTVRFVAPRVFIDGSNISTELTGFAPLSQTLAAVFSDPVTLDVVTTDATGRATYSLTIPSDLPSGDHHIVVSGVALDGSDMMWVVPVTIGVNGQILAAPGAQVIPGDVPPPDITLPATGGIAFRPIPIGLAMILLGLLAILIGRSRPARQR